MVAARRGEAVVFSCVLCLRSGELPGRVREAAEGAALGAAVGAAEGAAQARVHGWALVVALGAASGRGRAGSRTARGRAARVAPATPCVVAGPARPRARAAAPASLPSGRAASGPRTRNQRPSHRSLSSMTGPSRLAEGSIDYSAGVLSTTPSRAAAQLARRAEQSACHRAASTPSTPSTRHTHDGPPRRRPLRPHGPVTYSWGIT